MGLMTSINSSAQASQLVVALTYRGNAGAGIVQPRARVNLSDFLTTDELVRGDNVFFCATGVTDGDLLQGVRYWAGGCTTQSIVMRSKSGTVRMIDAWHRLHKLRQYSAIDLGLTSFGMIGLSLPNFWLGIMLILFVAVKPTVNAEDTNIGVVVAGNQGYLVDWTNPGNVIEGLLAVLVWPALLFGVDLHGLVP